MGKTRQVCLKPGVGGGGVLSTP